MQPTQAAALLSGLPELLQQRLRAELRPGEQLRWAGQPSAATAFRAAFVVWLLAAPFLALSLYYMLQIFRQPIDLVDFFSLLFHLAMILACVAFLHLPWRVRRRARYTVYAVSAERAIQLEGVGWVKARSFALTPGPDFKCVERGDGSGDLIFERDTSVDSDGDTQTTDAGFFGIADVAKVAALVSAQPAF